MALRAGGVPMEWTDKVDIAGPAGLAGAVAIAMGERHRLALLPGGRVVVWGNQTTIPRGLGNVCVIAAGDNFSVALRQDGTVVAWGLDRVGETKVPNNLHSVKAIAADGAFGLALKQDGTVVGWGDNSKDQVSIPPGLTGVVDITAFGDQSWVRASSRPAALTISMQDTRRTFTGHPQSVSATTSIPGAPITRKTYNGRHEAPTEAGTYQVVAESDSWGYAKATSSATLVIEPAR